MRQACHRPIIPQTKMSATDDSPASHRRLASLGHHLATASAAPVPPPAAAVGSAAQSLGPLIGYVSDERYLAVAGMHLEFVAQSDGARFAASSTASGAVCADLPAGGYDVALNLPGYGAKRASIELPLPLRPAFDGPATSTPYHFRVLTDQLLGYVWPKWCR